MTITTLTPTDLRNADRYDMAVDDPNLIVEWINEDGSRTFIYLDTNETLDTDEDADR